VAGQGEPGRRGGGAGDLNVIVRVKPHPIFRKEGDLVVCEVPLSMAQAALGAVVAVPTLDGSVEMMIPPGTQPGTVFRLRGKGAGKAGSRGDAHVKVTVEIPQKLTEAQKSRFAELDASLTDEQSPIQADFKAKAKP
jgi:molecular chaperone DnaJ